MNQQGADETSSSQSLPLNLRLSREASSQISILEQQRQLLPLYRKVEIFVSSFLAITSIHSLRTTYSFSKSYLPDEIDMDQKLIGIVDSFMLLFVGLGNFLIAVHPLPKPIRAVWVALLCCAIEYCLIPISMNALTGSAAFAVLLILMGLSGFLQSFMWPNLLPLVHSVFSPDKDTTLLGFWPTCTNFGNIFGFVICQLIVLNTGLGWEASMYIVVVYMASIAIYIGFRIEEMPHPATISTDSKVEQPLLAGVQRSSQSLALDLQIQSGVDQKPPPIIDVFKNSPKVTLLTISFSLLKSVMYGILLWLPAYFYSIGLVDYSLYIPMTFDGAAIIGSILLGAVFKRLPPHKKNLALLPVLFFLLIFFIMLKAIDFSVAGYFIIIGLVGLCLGGSFNTMAGLVTMQLVRTTPPELQTTYLRFYSALLMCIANIITGITQTIIGFTVDEDQGALFGIFVVYTAINLCSMAGVVFIEFYAFKRMHSATSNSQRIEKTQQTNPRHGKSQATYKQIQIADIK